MSGRNGFSLVEVLVVMVLLGIMMALALPPFIEWRQNLTYRRNSTELAAAIKLARSRAIQRNTQHQAVFDTRSGSYKVQQVNSGQTVTAGKLLPAHQVFLNLSGPVTGDILFNPNGTASQDMRLRIRDRAVTRYKISVEKTGRVRVEKVR